MRRADSGSYEAAVHSATWYSTRPRSSSVKPSACAKRGSAFSAAAGVDLASRARQCEAIRRPRGVFGHCSARDRKIVVSGKSVSVRVDLGGRRNINKKKNIFL